MTDEAQQHNAQILQVKQEQQKRTSRDSSNTDILLAICRHLKIHPPETDDNHMDTTTIPERKQRKRKNQDGNEEYEQLTTHINSDNEHNGDPHSDNDIDRTPETMTKASPAKPGVGTTV
jgi:hypothetical protein